MGHFVTVHWTWQYRAVFELPIRGFVQFPLIYCALVIYLFILYYVCLSVNICAPHFVVVSLCCTLHISLHIFTSFLSSFTFLFLSFLNVFSSLFLFPSHFSSSVLPSCCLPDRILRHTNNQRDGNFKIPIFCDATLRPVWAFTKLPKVRFSFVTSQKAWILTYNAAKPSQLA
jgi:hypothetical protein